MMRRARIIRQSEMANVTTPMAKGRVGDEQTKSLGAHSRSIGHLLGGMNVFCGRCGRAGHQNALSHFCPYHQPTVREFMTERAQLAPGERLAKRAVKSVNKLHTKYDALADHIGTVAVGMSRVRVAMFMILKVLLRANPAVIIRFIASGNELCKLMHLLNSNPAKRQNALNYLPADLRPRAVELVDRCGPYRYNLSAHAQSVKMVADQMVVNFKNHLQVQIPKRLLNYVKSELDRPAINDNQSVRLMETSTGGTFARDQAVEIIEALREDRCADFVCF